ALADAAKHTGLGLRTNRPRVYVVAGLGGGTGSGTFLDLAYLARQRLARLGYEAPQVIGLLLLPPVDRSTPAAAQATGNAFAALTELAHYGRPDTTFAPASDAD